MSPGRRSRLLAATWMAAASLSWAGAPPDVDLAAGPRIEDWAAVLSAHVRDGGVDYDGLRRDRAALDRFVESLDRARPDLMSRAARLAFWINAYNAVTLHHVLAAPRLPGSVRDVEGFFDRKTHPVAGLPRTLDAIEAEGRRLDPRVHFAVVCASTSCPDIVDRPYTAERIEDQLERQTGRFLADPGRGLRFDPEPNVLWLSSLFRWYAADFAGSAEPTEPRVVDWVLARLPHDLARRIRTANPEVRYLDYDWALNAR